MKRFLLTVLAFLTVTVVAYLGIYVFYNYRNFQAVRSVFGCEVLSPCNSHEQCGIEPSLFPEYGNLNSIASQPWIWEAKLRLLLETGKCHPKILIIDRGCHEPLWGYEHDEVAQLVARFLPLELRYKTCPYEIDWVNVLHYVVGSRSFTTVWAARPAGFRPKGLPFEVESRIKDHFENHIIPDEYVVSIFVRSLERLIELAQANGIEPVLLTTPKYRDYLAAEPKALKDINRMITQRLMDNYRIRYLDYSHLDWNEDYFFDADHLNHKGRVEFTRMLRRDLGYEVKR